MNVTDNDKMQYNWTDEQKNDNISKILKLK